MNTKSIAIVILLFGFFYGTALPQDRAPRLDRRELHQRQRIHRGVKGRFLARREAARFRTRGQRFMRPGRFARWDGRINRMEGRHFRRDLWRTNNCIYRMRRNSL